jgi:hypothetical protein
MVACKHSLVCQLFSIIVAITAILAPVGWSNIKDINCLLTLPVALWGGQYQATAGPLQGIRRSCKTPHCHHHNNTQYRCLHCPPCQRCQKQKSLIVNYNTQECNNIIIGVVYKFLAYTMRRCGEQRTLMVAFLSKLSSVLSLSLLPPLLMMQKMKTLKEIIIHKCNRYHPKSCLQIFHPHDAGHWIRELGKSNWQEC